MHSTTCALHAGSHDRRRMSRLSRVLACGAVLSLTLAVFATPVPETRDTRHLPTGPFASLLRVDAADAVLIGSLEEQLIAGPYRYLALRVAETGQLRWAVTLGRTLPIGARIRVRSLGRSRAFYSPRLRRNFSELLFGIATQL